MKKSKLFIFASLFFCINSFAQRQAFITIDGQSKRIENLAMQDSAANGRTFYTASFTINLSNDASLLYIMSALQQNTGALSFAYSKGGSFSERQYQGYNLLQADFSSLNAASRQEALKLAVVVRSMQVTDKSNVKFSDKNTAARTVASSNFSASFDNLPSNRIVYISGLQAKNNHTLRLEISAADLEGWAKWTNSPAKRINGSIALLAPNLSETIMQIKLSSVEIISLTQNINLNDERLERFTVILRVGGISISEK